MTFTVSSTPSKSRDNKLDSNADVSVKFYDSYSDLS